MTVCRSPASSTMHRTGHPRRTNRRRIEKRSARGLRDCSELAAALDGTRVISVMDREGDFFELFSVQRQLGNVDLLVRAKHDRKLGKDLPKLFDKVRAEPVRQRLEILPPVTVPVARKPKTDGRPATHKSPCAGAWWISRRPHGRRSRSGLRWFMSKRRKIRVARRWNGSC